MVAFLFTDIEGSTERWEQHRDAMDAAVQRHDTLMRAAIEAHGGHVFKTVGDAFCAAFARASDAVTAAVEVQLAIAKEDFSSVGGLRVRIGLHIGEASERDGDYFGPAINRVARLTSIGHGGQVVLSCVARDYAQHDLPAGATLTDLGLQRLKDLAEAEHVWQLAIAGLPSEFPPLKSLDALPNNLPNQPTSFCGREHDSEEVKLLLAKHQLLMLLGAGGVGKTRLALHVAADMLDHYPDGVWLADLASITEQDLVPSIIAQALGIIQVEDRPVVESIRQWLRGKKLLLILDGCEQFVEVVASLADAFIRGCPDVRMLATSRQVLGISGEVVHRLPSLAIPDRADSLRTTDALQYGSVALFVDRAKAADTRFVLRDKNAPVVADICRRLDGIPLAIELAAARVKVLSIPNLAKRLDDRFKILTGGSRTGLPRQQTLSALMDWSYDLLTTQEQELFAKVAIFAGSFSLDAAMAVCVGEGIDKTDILDLLSSLTDKSLVIADTTGDQERYRLLESTRAYALEKLTAAGARDRLARHHSKYFRGEAQAADRRWGTGSRAAWLASMEIELDNYRAVLDWALSDGHDPTLGAAVAGALERLWYDGGLTVEGRYWIARAQSGLDESAHAQVAAGLWRALARLSSGKGTHDYAKRALALYESIGDRHGAAWTLYYLGSSLLQMGRAEEAGGVHARALAAMRECGDKRGVAACFTQQGVILLFRGCTAAGHEVIEQALEAYRALGDESGTSVVLLNLAEVEFADGHAERALGLAREALGIHARGKNTSTLALAYVNTAAYCIALGNRNEARDAAREGLRWGRQAQYAPSVACALQHLALIGALWEDPNDAARLLGHLEMQRKELGIEREPTEKWGYEKLMAALREKLGDAEIEKLASEGAKWSEDRALEQAMKV
jgi:predicted ATPase/class 3 adenylate cyclase